MTTLTALRYQLVGLFLAALVLAATPALALNETTESSCDPDCAIKPPKSAVFVRQSGDLDSNGAGATVSATLAKGKKKTVVKVEFDYEWFTLSAQFRPFYVRINGKYPVNFLLIAHLDSCGNGECVRSATVWFDIDKQETTYPGQFYGQPLVVTLDSNKTADAGSTYIASMSIEVVKKK